MLWSFTEPIKRIYQGILLGHTHKVIYFTICRISYSQLLFSFRRSLIFFSYPPSEWAFINILLMKIPILLVQPVSFLTARDIYKSEWKSHLLICTIPCSTVLHVGSYSPAAWLRMFASQYNSCVYLGSLQILLPPRLFAASRAQPQGWVIALNPPAED